MEISYKSNQQGVMHLLRDKHRITHSPLPPPPPPIQSMSSSLSKTITLSLFKQSVIVSTVLTLRLTNQPDIPSLHLPEKQQDLSDTVIIGSAVQLNEETLFSQTNSDSTSGRYNDGHVLVWRPWETRFDENMLGQTLSKVLPAPITKDDLLLQLQIEWANIPDENH